MYRTDGGGEPPPPANMRAAATRWPVPRNAFRGAHNSWMHVLFLAICRERVQTMLPADTRTCTHIYAHVDNKNDLSYTRELLTMIIMSFIGTHLVSSLMHFFFVLLLRCSMYECALASVCSWRYCANCNSAMGRVLWKHYAHIVFNANEAYRHINASRLFYYVHFVRSRY